MGAGPQMVEFTTQNVFVIRRAILCEGLIPLLLFVSSFYLAASLSDCFVRGWSGPSFARRIAAASVNSDLASLFFPIFSCTNPICCFVLAHRGWPNTWAQSYVKPKSVQVVYSIGDYAVSQCCYSHRLACLAASCVSLWSGPYTAL